MLGLIYLSNRLNQKLATLSAHKANQISIALKYLQTGIAKAAPVIGAAT
jgi:hypothetical protein